VASAIVRLIEPDSARGSLIDRLDAELLQPLEMISHRLQLFRGMWIPRAIGPGGIARKLLVREIGIVSSAPL
jgi:hypothetical protein